MNFRSIFLFISLFIMPLMSANAQKSLTLGSNAPMLEESFEDVNGRSLNLSQVAEQNGLLVIFSCNTCPLVSMWEDRMKSIASTARLNGIGVIALNPNERTRDRGESLSDMKRRSTKQSYNFSYALDKDHKIADAFGATRTPEVFLFDGDMKLIYKGSIDDNGFRESAVEKRYLEDALQAISSGSAIKVKTSEPEGCSIKRIE
jgi:thioredoxin-related protein